MADHADLLFNANVRTQDRADTRAQAVAWRRGSILAVGSLAEVARAAGPGARAWDAAGATVLPGFIDAHHHPCLSALYGGEVRLAPPAVTDIPSVQRTLAAAASGLPPGQWLIATNWDEELLAERRPPTRRELDDAVPDRPVVALHYSCHRAVANSRALQLACIERGTPDPSGGRISRGPGGLPDGLLIERAMSRVETLARASALTHDTEGFLSRLARHHREMAAVGITRVVDATVPAELATLYREADRRGLLAVPTVMMPVSTTGYLEAPWDAMDGPVTGAEDGQLTVGPLKLIVDGAPACAMCLDWWQAAGALLGSLAISVRRGSLDSVRASRSLQPRIGRKIRTGITMYQPAEAREIVRAAVARGFAVAMHAIGNEAVDVALSACETAGAALGHAGAPRIEHAMFLSRELVSRIVSAGVAVVTQPHFMSLPAFGSAPRIPGVRNTPLRWLLDAGVKVAGSSDFPVAGFDPLDGIRAAVTRRTAHGSTYGPDQRIAVGEAIAMYTRVGAEVCRCLDRCGTLEAGKRADLVVIEGSFEADLDAVRVRSTVIGGEIVFGRPERSASAPSST